MIIFQNLLTKKSFNDDTRKKSRTSFIRTSHRWCAVSTFSVFSKRCSLTNERITFWLHWNDLHEKTTWFGLWTRILSLKWKHQKIVFLNLKSGSYRIKANTSKMRLSVLKPVQFHRQSSCAFFSTVYIWPSIHLRTDFWLYPRESIEKPPEMLL